MQAKTRIWLSLVIVPILGRAASAQQVRVVLIQGEEGPSIVTECGRRYPARASRFPPDVFDLELLASGRVAPDPARKGSDAEVFTIVRAMPAPPHEPASFSPVAPGRYARTDRTLPEDLLRPGAKVEIELPELGRSAATKGEQPIRMQFDLPANYRRETAHPVIVNFSGGRGGTAGPKRWRTIVGPNNFILVGADYDHHENLRRGLLDIGTCRDQDSRIALHALQILGQSTRIDTNTVILAGQSSGAYNITDNLKAGPKAWEAFAGFCAISGGSEAGSPKLDDRAVLLIMGENDTESRHAWLKDAINDLTKAKTRCLTVRIVPGVGHEWGAAMNPHILEWLATNFPALAAVERRRALLASDLSPGAKAILEEWIRRAGLE